MTTTQVVQNPEVRALALATDTEIASLVNEIEKLMRKRHSALESMRHSLGQKKVYGPRRSRVWEVSEKDTVEAYRAREVQVWEQSDKDYVLGRYDESGVEVEAVQAKVAALEEIFDNAPWSRFFLVTSSKGHVHSNRYCSTTYDTTTWGWLPEVSGLTEADAVKAHGSILCTVCFPTAPVEWTDGRKELPEGVCEGTGQVMSALENPELHPRSGRVLPRQVCEFCENRVSYYPNSGKARRHNSNKK